MAIKVQASRFAVLHVEDDDDSDAKDTKANQPASKAGQQATEGKKKAKKKKKAEQLKNETEELRNLAFCKVGKKGALHSGAKSGPVSDSQWEEWQQKNEENVDQEYEKELGDALLLSKLEFEEKERVREAEVAKHSEQGNEARNGEGKKNKKKGKGAAIHVDHSVQDTSDRQDTRKQKKNPEQGQETLLCMSGQGDTVPALNDISKANEKAFKHKAQEDLQKKTAGQKMSAKDYKEAILQKEEEVKQLREVNKKIEEDVAEVKKKNQQFYFMLGRGEDSDKAALIAELEEAQQTRNKLTEKVAQCSSELEKERSKSHALKAEREKLKGIKQHGGK